MVVDKFFGKLSKKKQTWARVGQKKLSISCAKVHLEKLEGVLYMDLAVQSMTPDVLKNIKRDNIRLDDFLGLTHAIKTAKIPTLSEIILGLPGETKESHFDTINQLMMT